MTDEQKKLLERLKKQAGLNKFIDDAVASGKKSESVPLKKYVYKDVEPYLIELAKKANMDISDVIHAITDEFILKQEDHHGNAKLEKQRGNAPYSSEDLKKIPEITESPDMVVTGIKRYKDNPDHIAYAKDGNKDSSIFIERLFPGKKELRSTAFYNHPTLMTKEKLLNILKMNSKSDLSNAVFSGKVEIEKAANDSPGSKTEIVQSEEGLPVVATSTSPSNRFSNNNITHSNQEIKGLNENFKEHKNG